MQKEELLKVAKPILFNTEMVKTILDGRKTVTRRLIKQHPQGYFEVNKNPVYIYDTNFSQGKIASPCNVGDILYVRETWFKGLERYIYKANYSNNEKFYKDGKEIDMKWKPSIHMPKEAARIFLKVKDVRVERLQEITEEQALAEGVPDDWPMDAVYCPRCHGYGLVGALSENLGFMEVDCKACEKAVTRFKNLWNSTIKKSDLEFYGWDANPWVWVIEFERIEV